METRYIFVTGGVTSSLGKGIVTASLGRLLKARGYTVALQKLDPYINVDPGTLNPYEHGECYVTGDGAETDLDLGHYERFLGEPTTKASNVTTGKVYQTVIEKERRGDFLGRTVQIIPHVTDEIKRRIRSAGEGKDFLIVEIGGTVGDMESLPFVEVVRQMKWELGPRCLCVHLTLVPYLSSSGELKTKPTQHSVKTLLEAGVQPDVLVLRADRPLGAEIRTKVARFCNVDPASVVASINVPTIYQVPLMLQDEGLDEVVLRKTSTPPPTHPGPGMAAWEDFVDRVLHSDQEITVALVGKYVELEDSYISIAAALVHAGAVHRTRVHVSYVSAETLEREGMVHLEGVDGILVAPGFGERGIEGKIDACRYSRTKGIPFLGICLGMQVAVVEFARNVIGMVDADSTEFSPRTTFPVIDLMIDQKSTTEKGGTMRLGSYECRTTEGSILRTAYGAESVRERHRHRYELNPVYLYLLESAGMVATGKNPATGLVEAVELRDHPWFVGVQYHPEYSSTVDKPHPLFTNFVGIMIKIKEEND